MQHPAALLKAHKLRASKKRGQNFLTQPATARAIALSAGVRSDDVVLEIGPGLGALTRAAAELAARVIALEVDRGIFAVLQAEMEQAGAANLELRLCDALQADFAGLAQEAGRPLLILGNLPYAITSPLLFRLVENLNSWRSATLMIQLEVARRLVSGPGGKNYGRLSVLAQTFCEIRAGMKVGPDQFFPKPAVDSQVVHLAPRKKPLVDLADKDAIAWFGAVVKAAFSQRRKTLANSLAGGLGLNRAETAEYITRAGLDPGCRAEILKPQDFGCVAAEMIGLKDQV